MTFDDILDQAIAMLQRRKRLSYRALKRQFDLDDEYLEDLKLELINPTTTFAIDTLPFSWYLFLHTHNNTRRQRMLPACRTAGEPFALPQFALTRSDLETFMDELRGFHTAFQIGRAHV